MKGYEFRLRPVLKLRKVKEENCRMELGKLIMELTKIEGQLQHEKDEIENYYQLQEGTLKTGIKASQLQAFPMLVEAKDKNIELLLAAKSRQKILIEEKKKELATLRGELKVMENLQEKDYQAWRKEANKEIDQKVEEQTQNWLRNLEKKGTL